MHSAPPRLPERALLAGAILAGAAVGVVDGTRAALLGRLDGASALATVALAAGLDALVGTLAGAVAALLAFAVRWGRAATPGPVPRSLGWAAAGLLCAGVAAGAVAGTALRNNRFLAAGVVTLAAIAAAVAGALLGPAFGRLLAPRAAGRPVPPATAAGVLLAAPLAALLISAVPFVVLWYARAPLRGPSRASALAVAAVAFGLLPLALARASRLWPSLAPGRAALAAAVGFGAPALLLARARWHQDLQYVRWNDAAVLVAIGVAGLLAARALARRGRPRRVLPLALGVPPLALGLFLAAGSSEAARKAASARAGLAGPVLAGARVALDFDGDGHTALLGGGDCDEGDPEVNPAAQDWPDDGIDQDCDGKDASAAALKSPPFHPVPDAVPPDVNVVFVTVDTLRADHLGCYGYERPTSPEIDRLAAEGIVFENGWAHSPSTRYSMPALATGRWPSAIVWEGCAGCESWWPRIGAAHRTLGQAMKDAGYATGALYAYSYFRRSEARGFERGIDDYQDHRAGLHVNVHGPQESRGSSSREIAEDAIAFVDRNRDRKFFLWLHFYDPHLDYQPHPEAPRFGDAPVDRYDGEVWYTDHHLGRVFARLRQLGLWERTVVFVTGDHGEGFGEKGISAHGYHLYPPQTKVPFVARVPGLPPRRVATPVGHVDIAPTLVNLARAPHEPGFLGRSMLDLMTGTPSAQAPPPPPVFQEVTYECATGMDCTRRRGLVTETHQLIWNWMPDNTTECYDLRVDPRALRDLWGTAAGRPVCEEMKPKLRDLVAVLALPPDFAERIAAAITPPGAPAPAPAHPIDARLGSAVRFVGYDLSSPKIARGGHADVVYHFEALERLAPGWKTFFHLQGPGTFFNLDHVPVEGAYPLERWRPGQRVRDRQRITIPAHAAPGTYTLYVGIYRGNERLPVTPPSVNDGEDRLRVLTLVVE